MPWPKGKPPSVAQNWPEDEQEKCRLAANGVLAKGGTEQEAIFACINAAGRSRKEHEVNLIRELMRVALRADEPGEFDPAVLVRNEGHTEAKSRRDLHYAHLVVLDKALTMYDIRDRIQRHVDPPGATIDMPVEDRTPWVKDVVPDGNSGQAVIEYAGQLFQADYTIGDDDDVTLGELQEVEYVLQPKELTTIKGVKAFETADGQKLWMAYTTNAFEDREEEIFSTKALEDYVAQVASGEVPEELLAELKRRALPTDPQGELWFWHLPNTKIGRPLWKGVEGRFLLELGEFDDSEMGQKAFDYVQENGAELALSHGYLYREVDRQDGVYESFWKFETSLLPQARAANPWTAIEAVDSKEGPMIDETQRALLTKLAGGDTELVETFIAGAQAKTEELEAQVAFKDADTDDATEDDEVVADETPDVPEGDEDEDAEPVGEGTAELIEGPDMKSVVEASLEVFGEKMAGHITEALAPITERLDALEAEGVPWARLHSKDDWRRPSRAQDNIIKADEAEKMAPAPAGAEVHPIDEAMSQ